MSVHHSPAADAILASLARCGMDLSVVFDTRHVAPFVSLPSFGREGATALLVGNTRAMWPHFAAAAPHAPLDPLDTWVAAQIRDAVSETPTTAEVFLPHEPPPRRLPFQRIAEATGLAWRSPAHLCVHPRYGPWMSLRAIVVLDEAGPGGLPTAATRACSACESGCLPAFEAAMNTPDDIEAWIAVRDACPLGVDHRFSDHQIRTHYRKDRQRLYDVPFWCEESAMMRAREPRFSKGHVVFVTNEEQSVALWSQRAGRESDGLVVWDYHVVLHADGRIWDLDCTAGDGVPVTTWLEATFPHQNAVPAPFRPTFRVLEVGEAHRYFGSDRSHMRKADGSYRKPPPPWPPIGAGHTLPDLLDTKKNRPGTLCVLNNLENTLRGELDPGSSGV